MLVDTNTQGDGEALADALRHRAGALLIGQPTVGAPDMPVKQTLPGGLQAFVRKTPYRYTSGPPRSPRCSPISSFPGPAPRSLPAAINHSSTPPPPRAEPCDALAPSRPAGGCLAPLPGSATIACNPASPTRDRNDSHLRRGSGAISSSAHVRSRRRSASYGRHIGATGRDVGAHRSLRARGPSLGERSPAPSTARRPSHRSGPEDRSSPKRSRGRVRRRSCDRSIRPREFIVEPA